MLTLTENQRNKENQIKQQKLIKLKNELSLIRKKSLEAARARDIVTVGKLAVQTKFLNNSIQEIECELKYDI